MTTPKNLPYVRLAVQCFDRRKENPLPLFNRHLCLDWEKLSTTEIADVLSILNDDDSRFHPRGFDETVKTISLSKTSFKSDLIGYRHAFVEASTDDLKQFHSYATEQKTGFHILSAPYGYIEDETGTPWTMIDIMRHVNGQEFTVIFGDPKSVIQLGPTSPKNEAEWTLKKANTISQFLDVVRRIYHSEWYDSPKSIASATQETREVELLEAIFPNDAETLCVLAYFRQLHAGDKLLLKACDAYLHHTGEELKRLWIERERDVFVKLIDSPPVFAQETTATRSQIIQMFMYGGRLLHSESNNGDEIALASLIKKHGKCEAILLFNSCLMDIYRVSANVYHVIQQDFHYWIDDKKMIAPSRVEIQELFSGFRSPPRGT